jgi:hypothetical protein
MGAELGTTPDVSPSVSGAGFSSLSVRPLRFNAVRDLYDAFGTAAADVGAPASDEPSVSFVEAAIEAEAWGAALSFCAYLLPRREAVWWGSQSLRRLMRVVPGSEALDAAEAWVQEPEEARRREALRVGTAADGCLPSTWIALAAGWSGGSIGPAQLGHLPARPEQTPKAIRAALLMVLSQMPAEMAGRLVRPCLDHALALALGAPREMA